MNLQEKIKIVKKLIEATEAYVEEYYNSYEEELKQGKRLLRELQNMEHLQSVTVKAEAKEPEIYDFYYSKEHDEYLKKMYASLMEEYQVTYVNGIRYTEAIKRGEKPMTSAFKDLEIVHTGTFDNITHG